MTRATAGLAAARISRACAAGAAESTAAARAAAARASCTACSAVRIWSASARSWLAGRSGTPSASSHRVSRQASQRAGTRTWQVCL
jgi:hypothetical protein